jgi:hypothetical protein
VNPWRNEYVFHSRLENEETSGDLFEVLGGWAAQTRWQRSSGHGFTTKKQLTPEDIISKWKVITDFGMDRLILLGVIHSCFYRKWQCYKPSIDTRGDGSGMYRA